MKADVTILSARHRFNGSFASGDGCWEWQRRLYPSGYGRFTVGHRLFLAHRVAYILAVGEIPEGLCVLHRCDNKKCVRPDHLFLGTQRDNAADMVAKGRQAQGDRHGTHTRPERVGRGSGHWTRRRRERVACGPRNAATKLTSVQVREIRAAVRAGTTQREIARQFGVSQGHVSHIARGKYRTDGLEARP